MSAEATRLKDVLSQWIAEQKYQIPVEWDAPAGQVVLGNKKGRTRTRFTAADLAAAGGYEKALSEAKRVVGDWQKLWASKQTFAKLPPQNKQDLLGYFGKQ